MNNYLIKLARNDDEKRLLARLDELTQKAAKGVCGQSDFMDLRQQELARAVAVNDPTINWHLNGGFEQAERKRLVVFSKWETEPDACIAYLRIKHKLFQEDSIGHRDYLGAVLSLGLKREKIGDIVVQNAMAFLIVDIGVADYICQQLTRIKHSTVLVEMVHSEEFIFQIPEFSVLKLSLASLRLDAAIAAAFNLSRSYVDNYIQGGQAQINHMHVYKCSADIKAGDLISVRGLGRFQLQEIGGTSRKGRYYVKIFRW